MTCVDWTEKGRVFGPELDSNGINKSRFTMSNCRKFLLDSPKQRNAISAQQTTRIIWYQSIAISRENKKKKNYPGDSFSSTTRINSMRVCVRCVYVRKSVHSELSLLPRSLFHAFVPIGKSESTACVHMIISHSCQTIRKEKRTPQLNQYEQL